MIASGQANSRRCGHGAVARLLAVGGVTLLLAAGEPASADGGPAADAPPVEVAAARIEDVPVMLTGLGTVQAFNTVRVKTRVEGELQQVLFDEGRDVKRGQLIAVVDPRTFQAALDQARGKLVQDKASLANAQLILGRDLQLGKNEFASQQVIDNQRSQVEQLQAQIVQDEALVAAAATQLSYTQITSPLDGRTGLRLVDQGNIVSPTDAAGLVVITQIKPIAVLAPLPEQDIERVRAALSAGPVPAEARARGGGALLDRGTLALVDNQIDPTSGTVRVKATFPNAADRLWPGQFVDLRIQVGLVKNAVTVPAGAIQRGPDGTFVYTVDPAGMAQQVPVKLGQIADGTAVIGDGLEAGARVIVSGQYRVAPGTHVAIQGASASDAAAR